jgi:hypothetical protein
MATTSLAFLAPSPLRLTSPVPQSLRRLKLSSSRQLSAQQPRVILTSALRPPSRSESDEAAYAEFSNRIGENRPTPRPDLISEASSAAAASSPAPPIVPPTNPADYEDFARLLDAGSRGGFRTAKLAKARRKHGAPPPIAETLSSPSERALTPATESKAGLPGPAPPMARSPGLSKNEMADAYAAMDEMFRQPQKPQAPLQSPRSAFAPAVPKRPAAPIAPLVAKPQRPGNNVTTAFATPSSAHGKPAEPAKPVAPLMPKPTASPQETLQMSPPVLSHRNDEAPPSICGDTELLTVEESRDGYAAMTAFLDPPTRSPRSTRNAAPLPFVPADIAPLSDEQVKAGYEAMDAFLADIDKGESASSARQYSSPLTPPAALVAPTKPGPVLHGKPPRPTAPVTARTAMSPAAPHAALINPVSPPTPRVVKPVLAKKPVVSSSPFAAKKRSNISISVETTETATPIPQKPVPSLAGNVLPYLASEPVLPVVPIPAILAPAANVASLSVPRSEGKEIVKSTWNSLPSLQLKNPKLVNWLPIPMKVGDAFGNLSDGTTPVMKSASDTLMDSSTVNVKNMSESGSADSSETAV